MKFKKTLPKNITIKTFFIFFIFINSIYLYSLWITNKRNEYKLNELSLLANKKTDKGMSYHGYTEIYEYFFPAIKNSAKKILEIGILHGGSLKLWKEYFPNAKIYGIDIEDKSKMNSKRISTFVADQANREQLNSFIKKFGVNFDIIIDDGGHSMEQQQISFGFLFPYLKPGGFYIIEDIHTSLPKFYPNNGVDQSKNNSTLSMIEFYLRNGNIKSIYLSNEEKKYLKDNIKYCNLFFKYKDDLLKLPSSFCLVKKNPTKL